MTSPRANVWTAYGTAWGFIGTMASGIIAWGGIGLLIDWLAGFRWLFLPIGMVLGVGLGIYLAVRRYGKELEGDERSEA
jgi:F0F1-type ATP synthase assembly protein I